MPDAGGEFVFQASGEACAICQALDGTETASLPHENCLCQIVPVDDGCDRDFSFSSNHYGPGPTDFTSGCEITVTCADGSSISESFEQDAAKFGGVSPEELLDEMVAAFDA